jgi:regulatory protein
MDADERRKALELAYRVLGARERTAHELRGSLERRGYGEYVVASVIEELTAEGLLDDERYARLFADDRRRLDQWGRERIATDLVRRGVAPDLVEAAVGEVGREDELAAALDLLEQKFRAPLEGDRDRDRAWRLLVRRGYERDLAYEAVRAHGRLHAPTAAEYL